MTIEDAEHHAREQRAAIIAIIQHMSAKPGQKASRH